VGIPEIRQWMARIKAFPGLIPIPGIQKQFGGQANFCPGAQWSPAKNGAFNDAPFFAFFPVDRKTVLPAMTPAIHASPLKQRRLKARLRECAD
jgi:hypothetical protein